MTSDMDVIENCMVKSVDFVIIEGNAQMKAVEDDIVQVFKIFEKLESMSKQSRKAMKIIWLPKKTATTTCCLLVLGERRMTRTAT